MQSSPRTTAPAQSTRGDIVFECDSCRTPLVVDAAAAGLAVECQSCRKPTRVPVPKLEQATGNALRISDLQRQLKENASQRTEITSYINQHSIQLHRWQLRLKDLNERKAKLESELAGITPPAR